MKNLIKKKKKNCSIMFEYKITLFFYFIEFNPTKTNSKKFFF